MLGLSFAGFNCPDFHIRWIQLVVDFLLHFLIACAVTLFVHRKFLRLKIILIGPNFDLHIRWIQLL